LKRFKREDWLGFVGVDAGDLLLEDEATTLSGNSNKDPVCKRNKKVSIIINDSKIFLTFHTINATKKKNNYMNL
jgi:hypothetical protein